MTRPLAGILPMLITPYQADGAVALAELPAMLELGLAAGADGLAVGGLAAEADTLSLAERRAIVETVSQAAPGIPLVVGCSTDRTGDSVALAEHAAARDAAAIMIAPPPPRHGLHHDEIMTHYLAVARAVAPTPLMVQDAPSFVGVGLTPGFPSQLADLAPNVRYAKPESVPIVDAITELAADPRLRIFAGHGGLHFLDALRAGAHGLIPGCEHPAGFVEIYQSWRSGDHARAETQFANLLPLLTTEFQSLDCYIASVKYLLVARGVIEQAELRNRVQLGDPARRVLLAKARLAGVPDLPPP